MKCCILIPYYNHPATVAGVVRAAQAFGPVYVVDDGSTVPMPALPGATLLRLDPNQGKGAALRAGFERATADGYTHAITIDADAQHDPSDLPRFLSAIQAQPDALIVGVRDFIAAGAPAGRRRSNAVSSFWFAVETGVRLADTQCGFRAYPLQLARQLKTGSSRYAFELEFMVRASWLGVPLVPVPVRCTYHPDQLRHSHFRPVVDLAHITIMNIGLVLQSWFVPRTLRQAWSRGEHRTAARIAREFFAENAQGPGPLALAVGLGLFCGIAPIWGYQLVAAAALAHLFKLNKAITMLASNISIPPVMPFILYGALALGHWLFTGHVGDLGWRDLTREKVLEYLGQWLVGSLVLGTLVAALGTVITYGVARVIGRK